MALTDILADKTKYPDDTKITLLDGSEATLGDLRGGYMRQQDYTTKTTAVAREREALHREREEFTQAKSAAEVELKDLAEKIVASRADRGIDTSQRELDALMERDPIAKRLRDEITDARKQIDETQKILKAQQEDLEKQRTAFLTDQHRRALGVIKQYDPEIDTNDLVQFAQQNGIPRLDLAYRLMTEDKRTAAAIAKAKEETSKDAYDRAKRDLAQPVIPSSRRVIPPSAAGDEAPKSLDEAAERALNDPEIINLLNGGG